MEFVVYSAARPIPEDMAAQLLCLMKDAFPPAERRTEEEFRQLFSHPQVQVLCAREETKLHGFMFLWVLDDFVFVENFAVLPSSRNLGLGSSLLEQLRELYRLPVILEVEPPEDELTRRRVGFYQRNGFFLNDANYLLPCLHEEILHSVPLMIMSAPKALTDAACQQAIAQLYSTVYEGKPIR